MREVNNVRGVLGFTGTYKSAQISVMGTHGIPSCSIYTKGLITDFGVKKSSVSAPAAVRMDVKLRDVVIGMGACTDSKVQAASAYKIMTLRPSLTLTWCVTRLTRQKRWAYLTRGRPVLCRSVLLARRRHVRRDGKIRHSGRGNGSGRYL